MKSKFSETIHKLIGNGVHYWNNLVIGQLMDLNSDYTDLFSIKPVIKNEFNEKLIEYKTVHSFHFHLY